MRKSKYGYVLLAMLVVTGLAGTITSTIITSKDRKFAVSLMKDPKTDLLKSVKGLSKAQLNFKSAPGKWSVKECVYHITLSEKNLWAILETALKQSANPEKRPEIKMTDDQVVNMIEDQSCKIKNTESFDPKKLPWKTLDAALDNFKKIRADHIKYIKNTTEDLRNHVVQMPFGWIDCYQLCLMIASHSNRYIQQLNEVKADPKFPKQ